MLRSTEGCGLDLSYGSASVRIHWSFSDEAPWARGLPSKS